MPQIIGFLTPDYRTSSTEHYARVHGPARSLGPCDLRLETWSAGADATRTRTPSSDARTRRTQHRTMRRRRKHNTDHNHGRPESGQRLTHKVKESRRLLSHAHLAMAKRSYISTSTSAQEADIPLFRTAFVRPLTLFRRGASFDTRETAVQRVLQRAPRASLRQFA